MSQPTQQYKKSFTGSVGSGMKSVFASNGRRYYVLEHRVSSAYHKAGESQKIIVDQIELGRDASCQVRFDESFGTVSRRHAAIVRDGDNWKLVQLSQTNSTYLNGQRVNNEWYLQNGDEIQLSTNGPKLGFIVPQGDKSLVKSIGLTARLNLFREQALRPYKRALTILSCVLVLALGVGGYFLAKSNQEVKQLQADNQQLQESMEADRKANNEAMKKLAKQNEDLNARLKKLQQSSRSGGDGVNPNPTITSSGIAEIDKYVYYIQTTGCKIIDPDGQVLLECGVGGSDGAPGWSGTGFLLNDGHFVTARHVVEAWYFWAQGGEVDENMLTLNVLANAGCRVIYSFVAVNGVGDKFTFTNEQFKVNRSHDKSAVEDGNTFSLCAENCYDYAYANISRNGGLPSDASLSNSLKRGTVLTVFGYPLGMGAGKKPLMGTCSVSSEGLMDGLIMTTDTDFEHGNSGGPVFYSPKEGEYVVVGIVSAVAGRQTGVTVPISVIR